MRIYGLIFIAFVAFLASCSNSELEDFNVPSQSENLSDTDSSDLQNPFNDLEYPYAGIPRLVVETYKKQAVNSLTEKIPAEMQLFDSEGPISSKMELTIRCRGNSSFYDVPKKSYKIKLNQKQAFFGMPKNKDWALVANYPDKTLLKNILMMKLGKQLMKSYTPQAEPVEVVINGEYLGVYILSETIEVAKQRVNISDNAYLVEIDYKPKEDDQTLLSEAGYNFTIHNPDPMTDLQKSVLKAHIDSVDVHMESQQYFNEGNTLDDWFDMDAYLGFYWAQEFSENPDGNFFTSVFFTWRPGDVIRMGPLWDFDLAFGGHAHTYLQNPEGWYIRKYFWNMHIFKKTAFLERVKEFWVSHREDFISVVDSLDVYANKLAPAAENNFKRWDVLADTTNNWHVKSYPSYNSAVRDLKKWIRNRITWIEKNL